MPPLLWKKTKKKKASTMKRVSRLVADLRSSSSNRGESPLVVQTGFPTSLIDLIINNWDRVKKSPSTDPNQHTTTSCSSSFEASTDSTSHTDASLQSSSAAADIEEFDQRNLERAFGKADVCHSNSVHEGEDEEKDEIPYRRRRSLVLPAVNMFLLSILAFGTRKLAIGVTLSAFLLLFLEFTGIRFVSFFKPCSHARRFLNSLPENVIFVSVQPEKKDVSSRLEHSLLVADCLNLRESDSAAKVEEIQVIESEFDVRQNDISCEAPNLAAKKKRILLRDDFVIEDQTVVARPRKMSNAKFKEKLMKKLVIFRKIPGSKSKKNKEIETDRYVMISNYTVTEDKLTVGKQEKEDEQQLKEDELEEIDDEHRCAVLPQLCYNEKGVENMKKMVNWNSAHLIPFVVVLTGLLGGRVMSLVLTMTWCTLSRLARLQKIQR